MRVLVSGAGGFLGGWITESLYLSGRAEVRAGVHRWESAARIASYPVEIAKCDVLDPATLSEALRGIDAIVHCAISKDYKVSTEGTRNLLEAAGRANIPRFIHVSSVAVYGDSAGTVS